MNSPDSLLDTCLEYISNHLDLLNDTSFPQELCEALIHIHTSCGRDINARFGKLFADKSKTKVKRVKLRSGELTAEGLDYLLKHELTHLDCSWCCRPPTSLLEQISQYGDKLVELSVGSWNKIEHFPGGFRNSPNLRKLEIYKWHEFGNHLTLPLLLEPLPQLVSLNLCGAFGFKDLTCLESLPNLRRLYLFKAVRSSNEDIPGHILTLTKLRNLTHLDISGVDEFYKNPDLVLSSIVEELKQLVYLDISGTNLAGRGVYESVKNSSYDDAKSDIIGLRSRVGRPLNFLGLYDTKFGACRRQQIPAYHITGDFNNTQLLLAAKTYIDRPQLLEKVLNEIYNLSRDTDGKQPYELFGAVLEAMERHVRKKMVQISGSASLFFVVKNRENQLTVKTRRKIVRILLNAMHLHKADQFMLRNGCLCLCQLKIPQDVMFEYHRLVDILLYTTTEMVDAVFVQRIAIYLLNSLACQVDGVHKHILGDAGTVPKMLALIDKRLRQNLCDDVMEVAWSTLWNVTDETANNCRHFLDWGGMAHFCSCLETFPDKDELLRNMMGLLGNVAEVKSLRPRLMNEEYVHVFTRLLLSQSDGIEVSYNAAGVLAHMCSDGEEAWTFAVPTRSDVLSRMRTAIDRWDLYAERNINYRSFEPILTLLTVNHTPECQLWATWALANLTIVYPSKYCDLVDEEGGLELLAKVAHQRRDYPRIAELSLKVIENCQRYKAQDYFGLHLEG